MNEEEKTQHIVLIGFMGCGKSTIGAELRRMLGYRLIDMDSEIEKRAGCRIVELFAREGEAGFRAREHALLQELGKIGKAPMIISTGGGVVLLPENRCLLPQLGYVVWLKADAALIYERTRRSRSRPILQCDNPRERIRVLLEERTPLYRECAHLSIDVGGLNKSEIASGIIDSARYHFSQPLAG